MKRATFLKRMAFAALACGFLDVPDILTTTGPRPGDPYGLVGFKEDLARVIYHTSPKDAPFVSMLKTAPHMEWNVGDLLP